MGIGKIDPEYAVREGWARDSDDEIYMDGYNAFIQVTTRDGTSGFQVKNDIGAVAFSVRSDGDGYVAKNLGVDGTATIQGFRLPPGATDGYILTSNETGVGTWQQLSDIEDFLRSKGKSFNLTVSRPGSGGNKWAYHETGASATDSIPIHFGHDVGLVGITYINKNPNTDLDLGFYVNGTGAGELVHTEEIRNARRHVHTESSSIFDIDIGDRLSIFIGKVNNPTVPVDTIVELLFIIRTDDTITLSSNTV